LHQQPLAIMQSHVFSLLFIIVSFCSNNQVLAQDSLIVVDKETGTPIRDVRFSTDRGDVYISNYRGCIHITNPFEKASISHPSYLLRKIDYSEITDTLWLLPDAIRLGEVVIWGKDRSHIKDLVADATKDAPAYAPAPGLVTFDFFKLFERKPLNKKARKKNEQLLRDWDKVYGEAPSNNETPPLSPP